MIPQSTQVTAVYKVREIKDAGRSEWDSVLEGAPGGGHVLQSHEWGEFKKQIGWQPVRLVLERDGEVVGVGQFLVYNTAPVPGSLWYCTKGPWLPWHDEDAVRAFFEGVRNLARRRGAHTIKIEPEVFEEEKDVKELLFAEIGFKKARYDLNHKTTMLIDLSVSEEELLAKMKSKTRYNIRLAARKGVEVIEPPFEEAWEAFFDLLNTTADRNGFSIRRSPEYLQDVMRKMHDAGNGRLFFATHEGMPLAGIYSFTFGEKYWYTYGASRDEKRNLMPTYLLQWEVMRWAKRNGLRYYDMVGVPNPENLNEGDSLWGVYKFKVGFGGEIADSLGCLDLPIRLTRAAAWHKFEPVYYRLYQKIKNNVFY